MQIYITLQGRIEDLPEIRAPTLGRVLGARQYMILPSFPKNCTDLKEFGPDGGVQYFTM